MLVVNQFEKLFKKKITDEYNADLNYFSDFFVAKVSEENLLTLPVGLRSGLAGFLLKNYLNE